MESVELRFNKGVLEYRSLIIHEKDIYGGEYGEPSGTTLKIQWDKQYSDWKAVTEIDDSEDA